MLSSFLVHTSMKVCLKHDPKKSKKHESARLVDVCYFKFYGNLTLKTVSKKTPFFAIWPALEILKNIRLRLSDNLIFKTDETSYLWVTCSSLYNKIWYYEIEA